MAIVVVKSNKYYMKVCLYPSLSYPACKSHPFCAVLYYHLLSVWLYYIFPYLMKGTI